MDLTGKKAGMMLTDRKIHVSAILLITVCSLYGCRHTKHQQPIASNPMSVSPGSTHLSDSQRSEIQFALARSLEQQGDLEKATAGYRKVLSNNPNHAEATHRLAIVHDQLGLFDQSEKLFHKLLKLKPGDPNVFCDLGYSLYLQNRWAESEMNLKQAIALQSSHRRAHNNLGLVLANLEQYEEAYNEFQLAGCTSTDAYLNLAYVLTLNAQWDEASQVYELALSKNPASQKTQIRLQELKTLIAQMYPDQQPSEQRLDQPLEQPSRMKLAANRDGSPQQAIAQSPTPTIATATQAPEPSRQVVREQPQQNYSQPEMRLVLEEPAPSMEDIREQPQQNYSQPEIRMVVEEPAPSMEAIRELIREEFQQNYSQPEMRMLLDEPAPSMEAIREVIREEFQQNFSQPEMRMVLDEPGPTMEAIREVIREEFQQNFSQPEMRRVIQAPEPSKDVTRTTSLRRYSLPVPQNRIQVLPPSRKTVRNTAPPRMMRVPIAARKTVRKTAPQSYAPSAPPRMTQVPTLARKTVAKTAPSSYLQYDSSRKNSKPAPMRTAFRKSSQKPRPMPVPYTRNQSPTSSSRTVAGTQHRSQLVRKQMTSPTRRRTRPSMLQLPSPQQVFAEKEPLEVTFWQ